jgi:hypothetical protein
MMRVYTVILLQLMIWSGYSLSEWLSKYDLLFYKLIMFFIFFYLAILISNLIIQSYKRTVAITLISLCMYGALQVTFLFIQEKV